MSPLIEFQQVSKTFHGKQKDIHAVRDVTFSVEPGEIFGVVGYSGAGKSTLLRMVNALERPESGKVIVRGQPVNLQRGKALRQTRKSISMIFQQFNLLQSRTVFDNVQMPLMLNHVPKAEREARVRDLLSFVELTDKAEIYPSKLSGGQKQRVGIARALATNPDILLCDEATSALDPKTTDSILELLKKVNRELNVTILMITHQVDAVKKICDRVAVMEDGRIVEMGETKRIFERPEQEITRLFVDTVIDQDIPPSILAQARAEARNNRVIRLRKIGEHVVDDVLAALRGVDIVVRVLFASVNALRDGVLTVLSLQFIGDPPQIEAAEATLRGMDIAFEEV